MTEQETVPPLIRCVRTICYGQPDPTIVRDAAERPSQWPKHHFRLGTSAKIRARLNHIGGIEKRRRTVRHLREYVLLVGKLLVVESVSAPDMDTRRLQLSMFSCDYDAWRRCRDARVRREYALNLAHATAIYHMIGSTVREVALLLDAQQ